MSRDAVLAIEVSQRHGGVAAARVGELAGLAGAPSIGGLASIGNRSRCVEVPVGPPDPDRDRLMPAIDEAMRGILAVPRELAAVVVSIGPGGFTGLRMAVACAKSLALALDCTLLAVPSAAVAVRSALNAERQAPSVTGSAPPAMEDHASILVALSSKGTDAWVSCVRPSVASQCRLDFAGILDAAGFEKQVEARFAALLLADEHLPASLAEVAARRGLARRELALTPSACLVEGLARWAADEPGAVTDPDALLPLYPREPEAVRLWRERGRSGATA